MNPVYSLVIPIFNEEAVLPVLLRRLDALLDRLDGPAEAIFVDDGSRDSGPIVLEAKARADERYRFIKLSRNFGHQIAITTGMDRASGDAVIVMDADLQDPPEVVLEMAAKWREGYQVVYAQRLSREGESRFKRWTADLFYRLIGRLSDVEIPRNVGDFRLVDRKVVNSFRAMPERDRFVRGMFAWLGFSQTVVQFHRPPRAAGDTKYSLTKMMRLALNGVIAFSDVPLRIALWAGMAVSTLAMLYGLWVVSLWATNASLVQGWSSSVIVAAFLGGANMMMTGIMGLYVGRIHNEVKARPLYVVDRAVGFPEAAQAEAKSPAARRPLLKAAQS
jgi:polyisoprenyl-phosphate glycosyltransferase